MGAEGTSGVVLAGGGSRRLGRDKALLDLGDGRPLLRRVVETLADLCDEVLVVAGRPERYQGLGLPARLVADDRPGQGPLAGLETALRRARHEYALVVACDLPFLHRGLLRHMLGLERDYQALVPRWQGHLHPLHAVYARSCLPHVSALLDSGQRQALALLERVQVRVLTEEEIAAIDPEGLGLFDLDCPEDLQRALQAGRATRWGAE